MNTTTSRDQQEFADQLAFLAATWLAPLPPDLPHQDPLPARLAGFVFSLFPELEGAGGLPEYRLSPKGRPDVDLVAHHLHDQWPDTDADNPDVRAFLTVVAAILRAAQAVADNGPAARRAAMKQLADGLCQLLEAGYELVAQHYDSDDEFAGPGDDVAPGLAAAFTAAWASTSR